MMMQVFIFQPNIYINTYKYVLGDQRIINNSDNTE